MVVKLIRILQILKIPSVIRRVEEVVDERMLNLLSEIIMKYVL